MKRRRRKSLYITTILMTVLPLVLLGIFTMVYCTECIKSVIYTEAAEALEKNCDMLLVAYDAIYPGDYSIQEDEAGSGLLKGGKAIDDSVSLLDRMKKETQVDFTIFYEDVRRITTITETDGTRSVGTKIDPKIFEEVYKGEKPAFYKAVDIRGNNYFASYSPIHNQDGTCVGIVFAGRRAGDVAAMVNGMVTPILLIIAAAVCIAGWFCIRFTIKLVNSIDKTESFLSTVSEGNLTETLDGDILQRKDEIGSMARSAVSMQKSLQELIEKDVLTGLYNRRHGTLLFKKVREETAKCGGIFSVAMCDIDYFKSINDTYGHEGGDRVLKELSAVLFSSMEGKGYAIRWGGEEFLLIFEGLLKEEAFRETERILEQIRAMEVSYGRKILQVTMTFGIAESSPEETGEEIIQRADQNLYRGKMKGRNQIVV